ncbi:hypothetical protein [Hymenobacter arizonensis]|uniref:Lipoprotein n=1 Tax=Hymenobacter arizonensis TaxID=1227077 RepID=A0A1I5V531_HYMAR|nr:hypothetical protein [Hymenobacter arizonensis]SFQ02619.1 hypothetical protein SAMN04515668_1200 [Hymenobacter arizonensis]
MKFTRQLAILALAPALLVAPACVSVKSMMKGTPSAAIANRLPALEILADQGPLAMNDGALPEDPLKLFQQECQTNLTEPTDTATFGYAKLVVKKVRTLRTGRGLQGVQVLTFLLPAVFGIPLEWYKTSLQAEVQVSDANGNLLGSYVGNGTSAVKVAMYHGYSQTTAPRLADIIALRGAMAQIRPQLDTATARLRPLLMAGGTVENPTLPSSSVVTGSR